MNDRPIHQILVVDDNETAALSLQKLLTLRGHTVEVAFSGRDALFKAQNGTQRVILLDIGLPDLDGFSVARALRGEVGYAHTIIALSGYGQEHDKQEALDAGFNFHLIKPAGLAEIEAILNTL